MNVNVNFLCMCVMVTLGISAWMFQVLDMMIGFPRPSRIMVIDYISPTCYHFV